MKKKKSLNQKFSDLGYLVVDIIPDKSIDKGLSELVLKYASGRYKSIKIIPSDIAVWGERESEFIPEPKSHLVYGKYNIEHPEVKELIHKYTKPNSTYVNMTFLQDSEGTFLKLNKNYTEQILKLRLKKKKE
ncbi:MAG: hypothetical protein AABW81_01125 [Nanoarchaeota archaeon]